jgi:hypothetical protein
MKRPTVILLAAVALLVANAYSDDTKKAAPSMEGMIPKAGPEHAVLKQQEGVWDATVESLMAPGAAPIVSTGVETNTLMGGLWLVTDFKGEFMGTPFLGHGMLGYDSSKKKYVSTWVDSMSVGLQVGESTFDAAKKTMAGSIEGPDMTGKLTKMTSVVEWKDADTRVFTMTMPGADGKLVTMRITYKRRK